MKLTNELRLGNLVSTKYMGMVVSVVVDSISHSGINLVGGDGNGVYNTYDLDEISPIELTEEWLLRLGFEPMNSNGVLNSKYLTFNGYTYCLWSGLYKTAKNHFFISKDEDTMDSIEVLYVHQLQNLYFCLVGEELTIDVLK